MKQQVRLSTYSIVLSIAALTVLLVTLRLSVSPWSITAVSAVLIAGCALALYYMPLSISADDHNLYVNRSLRIKRIPLAEIDSIELTQPTMAERHILASNGWFGHWGWSGEKTLGKYFAYYGKASDCFLIRLKDGRRYMLGCENPACMVSHIDSRLSDGI